MFDPDLLGVAVLRTLLVDYFEGDGRELPGDKEADGFRADVDDGMDGTLAWFEHGTGFMVTPGKRIDASHHEPRRRGTSQDEECVTAPGWRERLMTILCQHGDSALTANPGRFTEGEAKADPGVLKVTCM